VNILVLSSDYPVTTRMPGSPRLFNLCRQLARKHSLTLAFLPTTQQRGEQFSNDPDNRQIFHNVITLPFSQDLGITEPTWLNRLRHRFSFEPYFLMRKLKPKYLKLCRLKIGQILAQNKFDIIYVNGVAMLQYVSSPCSIPIAFDFCDCTSLLFLQNARLQDKYVRRLVLYCEARGIARWEKEAAARADLSIVITQHDEEGIRNSCPGARTLIIPNGIDGEYFSPGPATEKSPSIGRMIFTGVMSYGPNADAALFFGKEVFPLIKKEVPGAEFWVVGANPPDSLKAISTFPGIRVTGTVEDVRPFLHKSDVFVCPLRYGTGMKNKILAALAMKIPVIATPNSVHGIKAVNDEHLLLAESPQDFVRQVSCLIGNPERTRMLTENGRKLIEEHYSWNAHGAALEQALVALTVNGKCVSRLAKSISNNNCFKYH
jgi:sugar transferase (PEP-CTERM/EpsH1 system associated)